MTKFPVVIVVAIALLPAVLHGQKRGPGSGKSEGPEQVIWSVADISDQVPPGGKKEIRVKFRPASDLGEVELWLTPSLSKAITPRPQRFNSLKKDQEYEVTLVVLMPEVASQEAFNGTIHLRHVKETLRSPLQVRIEYGAR